MTYEKIREAVAAIAAQCDGAESLDGVGFNGTDTHFGRAAADAPLQAWTPGLARQAWEILHKYSGQLETLGIDYADLPVPDADPSRDYAYVEAAGDRLVFRFPYDPSRSDTLKRTVPGLRWNPTAKTWWAKPSPDAITAAEAAGFTVTDDARALAAEPVESGPAGTITLDGDSLVIAFEYDPRLVAAVKALPSRRFASATKTWVAPIGTRAAVLEFAATYGFDVDPAVTALDDATIAEAARPRVTANGVFTLRFDYDAALVQATREIPGARWDPYDRAWTAPREAGFEVLVWAQRCDAIVDESCGPLFAEAEAEQALIAASSAKDADLQVEGLLKPLMPFQRAGVQYALSRLGF
jgi:hypothetical protein